MSKVLEIHDPNISEKEFHELKQKLASVSEKKMTSLWSPLTELHSIPLSSPPFYSPPLPISCRSSGIDESNPRNKGLQSSSMTSSRFRRSPPSRYLLFFQPPGQLQQKKAGEASVCSLANVPWNSLQPSC